MGEESSYLFAKYGVNDTNDAVKCDVTSKTRSELFIMPKYRSDGAYAINVCQPYMA